MTARTTLMDEHARAYAERGWAVLPLWQPAAGGRCGCGQADCPSPGKHPIASLVPHGLQQATSSAATVRAWWSAHPRANVGVRTGTESGVVVLDVDGREGLTALGELARQNGRFAALWARTGSGGWHAYLAHPGVEVPNSAKRVGPGLDVRGDGGYVVAPPSEHATGNRYRWVTGPGERLSPMPNWLLSRAMPSVPLVVQQPVRVRAGAETAYVASAIDGEARDVAAAPTGQRNDRLNLAAYRLGRLVGSGLAAEGAVTDSLMDAARAAGLGEREACITIRSGLRAGAERPRHVELTAAVDRERGQEAEAC